MIVPPHVTTGQQTCRYLVKRALIQDKRMAGDTLDINTYRVKLTFHMLENYCSSIIKSPNPCLNCSLQKSHPTILKPAQWAARMHALIQPTIPLGLVVDSSILRAD